MNHNDIENRYQGTSGGAVLLSQLKIGEKGVIVGFDGDMDLNRRLVELGLAVGATVEVAHAGPIGGDPMAIRVKGALLGIGRREAANVRVEVSGRTTR